MARRDSELLAREASKDGPGKGNVYNHPGEI